MKYKISDSISVNSHQTARSHLQASKHVIDYIDSLNNVGAILDFGCGKLRYSVMLKNKCQKLYLVDSKEQILRKQVIHGERTTLQSYVTDHLDNTFLNPYHNFLNEKLKYDLIFCSNVLSAIPDRNVRTEILQKFKSSLSPDGKIVIINQYWNSFYKILAEKEYAIEYEDGILTLNGSKSRYYGLLDKETISEILMNESFEQINCWYKEQICFVECS